MARSSSTRIDTTTGVSGLARRPRSAMTLEMIPDDDTAVMPAIASDPGSPQPSTRPATAPGAAPSTRSTAPAPALVRRLATS